MGKRGWPHMSTNKLNCKTNANCIMNELISLSSKFITVIHKKILCLYLPFFLRCYLQFYTETDGTHLSPDGSWGFQRVSNDRCSSLRDTRFDGDFFFLCLWYAWCDFHIFANASHTCSFTDSLHRFVKHLSQIIFIIKLPRHSVITQQLRGYYDSLNNLNLAHTKSTPFFRLQWWQKPVSLITHINDLFLGLQNYNF